jgi:hypothetical protein
MTYVTGVLFPIFHEHFATPKGENDENVHSLRFDQKHAGHQATKPRWAVNPDPSVA